MGTSFLTVWANMNADRCHDTEGIFFIAGVSLLSIALVLFDCCDEGLDQ